MAYKFKLQCYQGPILERVVSVRVNSLDIKECIRLAKKKLNLLKDNITTQVEDIVFSMSTSQLNFVEVLDDQAYQFDKARSINF